MLEQADGRLNAIRQTSNHKDAGGLVIARSTIHANQIVKILEEISGTRPYLVHSNLNEDDTNSIIDQFRHGTAKWIVSVKMISEGVDIKRLRVGVYLTNIKSRVFFMQAIGRVIRWIDGVETQMSFFYFPQIEPWIKFMKEITLVVRDSFDPNRTNFGTTGGDGGTQPMLFVPIHGEVTERSQVHDSQKFNQQTLADGVDAFGKNFPGVGMDFVRVIGEASITKLAIQLGWVNSTDSNEHTQRHGTQSTPTPKHKEHQESVDRDSSQ